MSAPVTEAHRLLASEIHQRCIIGVSSLDTAQLLADSEARAVEAVYSDAHRLHAYCRRHLTQNQIAHLFGDDMTAICNERDTFRADAQRLSAECERLWKAGTDTWSELRAHIDTLEALEASLRAECERLSECNRISTQSSISLAKQRDEAEASLSEMIKQSRVDSSVAGIAICNEMGAIARAEKAEAALRPLVGAVESIICDSEGTVAHIFEREPGFDKCRLQIALDRARQACATIPITKGDK